MGEHQGHDGLARIAGLGEEHEVVAVWAEHSAIGHHYEELRADGTVDAWTEPPVR
ncbi:hypothetical protein [Streptomyces sp. NPDC002994]|uniref:hypothetical protein n=1 Tax=Streptomyces sp. NPDC002994 TaxID=3154441 RepID=UPI0033AE5096